MTDKSLARCMGGRHCNHTPGTCTATNAEYQAKAKAQTEDRTPPAAQASDADLLDEIAEAISDTLDMDWRPSWAAPNIMALINRERAAAHASGRAERQAEVVRLLKRRAVLASEISPENLAQCNALNQAAAAIERGQDWSKNDE